MDFVVALFAGDQFTAVVDLALPHREHGLVLFSGQQAWAQLRGRGSHQSPVTARRVLPEVRDLEALSVDLRRVELEDMRVNVGPNE